jgi:hypothetical protein
MISSLIVVVSLEAQSAAGGSPNKLGGGVASVDVADKGRRAKILDREIVRRRADVSVLAISLVLPVDPGAVHEGVSGDRRGHGQDGRNGGLYFVGTIEWISREN